MPRITPLDRPPSITQLIDDRLTAACCSRARPRCASTSRRSRRPSTGPRWSSGRRAGECDRWRPSATECHTRRHYLPHRAPLSTFWTSHTPALSAPCRAPACSLISGRRFVVVFGARLAAGATVSTSELGYAPPDAVAAVEANASAAVLAVDASTPLELGPCDELDFRLLNLAPREANGWALLGEVSSPCPLPILASLRPSLTFDPPLPSTLPCRGRQVSAKWVGASPARFHSLSSPGVHLDPTNPGIRAALSAELRGAPGEKVPLPVLAPLLAWPSLADRHLPERPCLIVLA